MAGPQLPSRCARCGLAPEAPIHDLTLGYDWQHTFQAPLVDQARAARPTVSIMAACALVSVSRRTIYNWMAEGKVEWVRTAGGAVRLFPDTLWRAAGPTPRWRGSVGAAAARKVEESAE